MDDRISQGRSEYVPERGRRARNGQGLGLTPSQRVPYNARTLSTGPPMEYGLMMNSALKDAILAHLPKVQTPAQYLGGELNSVVKDHRRSAASCVWRFPIRMPWE